MSSRRQIGQYKTCIQVFRAKIQRADSNGAACILAERVKESENVLKVKAGKKDFIPSSLTVLTTDGQVFACKVYYIGKTKKVANQLG